ncbi:per os infectivity factor 2 [Diatraea saccharalis granulovirus]|uniref:Per os infectivity factor 2 n=1 Tax=Diatraea saccharalis granulovirus TaxID=1675862 RepID=A0A0R7EYR5_9BBAC|nr:per os infectivity factor 2 [Diatraea saccharalis granulovirus]AKN80720.1 per os infectivity factor 2 [Diatraea saccharalis granulovirus]
MFVIVIILFVLFIFLLYSPLQRTYEQIYKEKVLRNKLLNDEAFREGMRQRRYAPLHTLPTVRWYNNFDTLEGSSSCFSIPTLVTNTDSGTFDCVSVCNDERAVYFFVGPNDKFVVNGALLASGGYCTLNSVPKNCNTETSLILYSVNQWTCIAEDPRFFAGTSNLIQIAGRQHNNHTLAEDIEKNVLWDNMLNRVVNPNVNTFRNSWDDMMPDGRRRFEVRCGALDTQHNEMFLNPFNPIECLPNVCTVVNWAHRDVKPDFRRGVCECGDINVTRVQHINQNDPTSQCASNVNRLNENERSYTFRVECLSLDTPIELFSEDKFLCPPGIFNQNTDFSFRFVLNGVIPLSGNGIHEPTTRLWRDTRNRVIWNQR